MIGRFLILSAGAALLAFPAMADETNNSDDNQAAKVTPLLKMEKPKLKVVFTKTKMPEDEIVSTGTKTNDPVICKTLEKTGSRISKGNEYCAPQSAWDARERDVRKRVREVINTHVCQN